jgi:superfamily II DNA or RNA helicase
MFNLRPYQQECVSLVKDAYQRNPHGRELLVIPTGGGKTVIFSQIIHDLSERYGINTLVLAHTDALLDQAADKYHVVKPTAIIGKVGGGIHEYGGELTVASVATVSRHAHIKHLQAVGYGLVIVDEAHHAAAKCYQRVLHALPHAFVLMVTATPDRLDKREIINKPPLYSCSIVDMIEQGYLCDVRAIAIKTDTNLDEVHTQAGDFNEQELALAVNTPARNKRVVDAYREHAMGRRAICFAVTVKHASDLCSAFTDHGVPAATVAGETPLDERRRMYKGLRDGSIKVLTNVQVLTEGFDEPLVDCVIMARPTQSRGLYTQCVGRGLRIAPVKQDCLLLDLTDNCLNHRLQPQTLSKAIGRQLKDTESVQEAKKREENEEREAQVRTLKEQRHQDVQINLLEKLEWKPRTNGDFVLEVGQEKHRIALIPSTIQDGYYTVAARLAPDFTMQVWAREQPLEYAQQAAEKRARMLLADNRSYVDRHAPWRNKPIDPNSKQVMMLKKFGLPMYIGMTKGEAADLIDAKFAELERQKKGA